MPARASICCGEASVVVVYFLIARGEQIVFLEGD
jgi:hypothetical protein